MEGAGMCENPKMSSRVKNLFLVQVGFPNVSRNTKLSGFSKKFRFLNEHNLTFSGRSVFIVNVLY